nr:MAG TPA: hypothetical protein [Caudoviricetes sp.]
MTFFFFVLLPFSFSILSPLTCPRHADKRQCFQRFSYSLFISTCTTNLLCVR